MSEINHPAYYNTGKIEVIEFIEDQKLQYHLGNAVKYISRAGRKNVEKTVEDVEKAIWYLRRFIEIQKTFPCRPNEMNPEQLSLDKEVFTVIDLSNNEAKGEY